MKTMSFLAAVLLGAALPYSLFAATSYPDKPIRVIVPVGTGGGLDRIARSVVARLGDNLGQIIVVDNRAGAGGDIGVETAAHAGADGYTLLMVSANYVVRAAMYKVPYDAVRDFAPVSQVAEVPLLLVVHASVPAKTVAELVAHAKANPGKLNYSSPGNGSLVHLSGELFKAISGIDMVHVPYKGVDAAFTDLIAGRIQLTFTGIVTARPYVKLQKLRGLAVTSARRAKTAPEWPTMAESGVSGFEATQWHGLVAPAGTPRSVIARLNREIVKVLQDAEVAQRMATDGTEAVGSSPEAFAQYIRTDYARWQKVIYQAGIRGD